MPQPVLIIRTGRAPDAIRARHGDFPHWFRLATGIAPDRLRVVDVAAGEALPDPAQVAAALITGSAAMVTERAAWSERTAGWIRQAMDRELPMFGVCYGHQLMAHALGGRVDYLPGGREIGTVSIACSPSATPDPVAYGLPAAFRAAYFGGEPVAAPHPHTFAPSVDSDPDPIALARAYEAAATRTVPLQAQDKAAIVANAAPQPAYAPEIEARGGDALYRANNLPESGALSPMLERSGQWLQRP